MKKGNPKINEASFRYAGISAIIVINGVFLFPMIRRIYNNFFVNKEEVTHICYMDLSVDGKPCGTVDFGLFGKVAPKNINNFLHLLIRGELGYTGTYFHKIVPKYILYGGDIIKQNGTGHLSVFNNEYLEDEIIPDLKFCEPGLLALSNKGKDTNGSQFFITLDDLPFLDNKYTIIGRIVKGYEIVKRISTTCGDIEGNTKCVVKIEKGGIYKYDEYKKKNRNFKL